MVSTLVAVASGTRHPGGARTVEALVARVRHRLPDVPVRTAYDGIQRPSLPEALAGLPGPAVVVPLLPGSDRLLAEVLAQRLREAGARPGQPAVLVAAGSSDPGAQGGTARAARLLQEVWRGPVRAAHLTGRGERMSSVVAELDRLGVAPPAVAPYLVEPGELHSKARDDARCLGLTTVADVLGDHPWVAETVARRYRAAVAHRFALSLSSGVLVSSASASAAPHPDRRRSRRSAQHAALSRLGLAGPGADATPATDAAFPNMP
jgi:sirohydrochlorin ferrochelatase